MLKYAALLLAIFIGALTSIQSAINAQLGKFAGSIGAALISFCVGTITLIVVYLATGEGGLRNAVKAPPYLWVGGMLGAVFVFSMIWLLPRIGAGGAIAGVIAGQLILAMLIDQLGLFGLKPIGITWTKGLGAVLLLIGVKLMGK